MTDKNQSLTAIDAINEFYRLKDKYETEYNEKYVKPIVKSNKPNKFKRIDYSRLPKHECINCKRNVGTIFSIKQDFEEDVRKFIAKCGDLIEPCPLDIQINYSIRDQMYNSMINGSKGIEDLKLAIIKEKNKALFFNKDVVSSFETLTTNLKTKTESVGLAIETNILRNHNPEKIKLIKKNVDEFSNGFILPFKQLISNYMDTDDILKLNQAIKFYVDEMIPKLNIIQEMKYPVNFVEYENDNDIYKLFQYSYSIEDGEFFIKNDDKIIKFVKGVKKSKKINTMKTNNVEISTKNKTKKLKQKKELVLEEDESMVGENQELVGENQELVGVNQELVGENQELVGENQELVLEKQKIYKKEYDVIWSKIPEKLKEYLNTDPQWLEEYINSCIIAKKNSKRCVFFLPRQTKIPPNVLKDGTYDFNSTIVNKLFNSLETFQKKTLLSLNDNLLKNNLTNLLTNDIINYNNGYY